MTGRLRPEVGVSSVRREPQRTDSDLGREASLGKTHALLENPDKLRVA